MYAQLLIATSFVLASYQDFRDRAVSDLVWLPALAGAVYVVYAAGSTLEFQLVKVGLIGGIGLAFAFYGAVGQADAIAMALVAADPNPISPLFPLSGAAIVALAHIGYEFLAGNAGRKIVIPMDRFLREQRWIPKAVIVDGVRSEVKRDVNVARDEVAAGSGAGATVEVAYGVPTVAYLGIGYVAYLAFLIIFYPGLFASLA